MSAEALESPGAITTLLVAEARDYIRGIRRCKSRSSR